MATESIFIGSMVLLRSSSAHNASQDLDDRPRMQRYEIAPVA